MPNISKILNNSIYFENCISNNTWTLPSHITMFTGLYSTQIKLVSSYLHKLSFKIPVITEILRDLGYFTVCYTENPWINDFFRLTRGFSHVFTNQWRFAKLLENNNTFKKVSHLLTRIDYLLKKRISIKIVVRVWNEIKKGIKHLLEIFLKSIFWKKWLFESQQTLNYLDKFHLFLAQKLDKEPLYFFFNFMASHSPYVPVKEALKYCEFDTRDFKLIKNFLLNIRDIFIEINIKSKKLPLKKIEALKRLYDSSVHYNDIIIGKLFTLFNNVNLLDNSYIIITSDHGEHLFDNKDHYFYGHGVDQSAYESLIKVPLIIFNTQFKKKIVKEQVELKDIFHTILHMTGVPNDKNKHVDIEKSILYQIDNDKMPEYIYGEHLKHRSEKQQVVNKYRKFIEKDQIHKILNDFYFLRSNRYKYINYQKDIEEFYNLTIDPFEQSNLVGTNNEQYKEMKNYLHNFRKEIKNLDRFQFFITEEEKKILKNTINKLKFKL